MGKNVSYDFWEKDFEKVQIYAKFKPSKLPDHGIIKGILYLKVLFSNKEVRCILGDDVWSIEEYLRGDTPKKSNVRLLRIDGGKNEGKKKL